MKIQTSHNAGFTLVEIMIVIAIIGLVAGLAIPNMLKARTRAQTNACIANLKQLDGAVQQWGVENKKTNTETPVATDVAAYLKGNVMPVCPGGGSYTLQPLSQNTLCNITGHSI